MILQNFLFGLSVKIICGFLRICFGICKKMKHYAHCTDYCQNMDLQETFKEEWRQIIAKMITDGTLQQIDMPPNDSNVTLIAFVKEGSYIKSIKMHIFSKYGLITSIMFPEANIYLFSDAPCYRNFRDYKNPIIWFFKTVCNTYSTNELRKLLIFTIHEFYCDLQETRLSNVEMVLRDCYLIKYIQKY